MKKGNSISSESTASLSKTQAIKYSTNDLPANQRQEWLHEIIGREYANVEITPPAEEELFNEMIIYPWNDMRLSSIRSSEITLQRKAQEPNLYSQDAFFVVVLLSGNYRLQQNGKEVFLQPGDISLYDATLAHKIDCLHNFSKLIISIPRPMLKDRIARVEQYTALRIPGNTGIGLVAANFIRSTLNQADHLNADEFSALSEYSLDLLTLAFASVHPTNFNVCSSRIIILNRIKDFIGRNLSDPEINPDRVSDAVGISPRYINKLFKDENTSLMRYILKRRLENCRKDLRNPVHFGHQISEIAFRWGFNDCSHFSRVFKHRYGCTPKEYREKASGSC